MVCVNHRIQSHISILPEVSFLLNVLPLTTFALSCFLTYAAGGMGCEFVGLDKKSRPLGERMKTEVLMCLPCPRNFLEPLCYVKR
jgi:hypothetical protein